jgi:hypothetical protein
MKPSMTVRSTVVFSLRRWCGVREPHNAGDRSVLGGRS